MVFFKFIVSIVNEQVFIKPFSHLCYFQFFICMYQRMSKLNSTNKNTLNGEITIINMQSVSNPIIIIYNKKIRHEMKRMNHRCGTR